jgi:hypothetical protein
MSDVIAWVAALAFMGLSAAAILLERYTGQTSPPGPRTSRRRPMVAPIEARRPLKSRRRNVKVTLFSS